MLSACALIFSELALLVNHMPNGKTHLPPPYHVASRAYGDASFFLSQLGGYASIVFLPLLTPPVLWLALNPTARALFLGFGGVPRDPPRSRKA